MRNHLRARESVLPDRVCVSEGKYLERWNRIHYYDCTTGLILWAAHAARGRTVYYSTCTKGVEGAR